MEEKLAQLARSRTGRFVIEYLESIQQKVADVRTPLNVRPEIANEVRLGVIQVLDEHLVGKLKVLSGKLEAPDPNEHI